MAFPHVRRLEYIAIHQRSRQVTDDEYYTVRYVFFRCLQLQTNAYRDVNRQETRIRAALADDFISEATQRVYKTACTGVPS